MTDEINKAVEAGKLNTASGNLLATLTPGTFVQHKSWGYGKIASHDFLLSQTVIDFKVKKGHFMQFQYAVDSLTVISPEHIGAQIFANTDGVRTKAMKDPASVVRTILVSVGGRATQDQIMQQVLPSLFNETTYKKWWEAAKKALKADPLVGVPQKKTEHFVLREEALSQTDELLNGFKNARTLKEQIQALDNLAKGLAQFNDPSVLQPVLSAIENVARRNMNLKTVEALQMIVVRDELMSKFPTLVQGPEAPSVAGILRDEEKQLVTLLGELPVSKLKKAVLALPEAFGEAWPAKAVFAFMRGNSKIVPEAARLLIDNGLGAEFGVALDKAIREQSISAEALHWLCEDRNGAYAEIALHPRVLSAVLAAMERDQFKEKRDRKLHDLLLNDHELVLDLIATADDEELREALRKVFITPVFEELNKRSILGRIVRTYPELEGQLSGKEQDHKKNSLVVSWESLERRKLEFDDIVNKKIPQNRQDIQIALDYGDLRENFEYKSAKEQQRVLTRLKSELERDLTRAQGTDFADAKGDQVALGTTVKIKFTQGGETETYSVLGAWDTDPAQHYISYLSQMAQALIGKKVGDRAQVPTEGGEKEAEIVEITIWKKA